MRKRIAGPCSTLFATLAGLLLATAAAPAATITVSAPERAYDAEPVSVVVPKPRSGLLPVLMDEKTGARVPCQAETVSNGVRLWWIVRDLPRGAKQRYALRFAKGNAPAPAVSLRQENDAVTLSLDGKLFTRYVFSNTPRPYCYPVIGPTGAPLTRSYPMADVSGEPRDHPHHRSFWFAHGEVNGQDFWTESARTGKIVHRDFTALESGPVLGILRTRNDWVGADGKKVCEDEREIRLYHLDGESRCLDFTLRLRASEGAVTLGDTKEGTFGFRVTPSLQVKGGQGHMENARGERDAAVWGKPAEWCDDYGPVNGETVGIAILDHPENPRHPTYWQARDYGLFAVNPFGLRDFIGDKTGKGRLVIPAGEALTLRYRVFLHRGSAADAGIAARYAAYANPPVVSYAP